MNAEEEEKNRKIIYATLKKEEWEAMIKESKEEVFEAVYRVQIGYMVGGKRIPKGTRVTIVEYLDQGGRSKVQVKDENGRHYTMGADVFDAAFGYIFDDE